MGFEPTVGFPTLDFESSALNRTQPPFLSFGIVGLNLRCAIITRTPEFEKAKHHASFQIAMIITLATSYAEFVAVISMQRSATSCRSSVEPRPAVTESNSTKGRVFEKKCYNFRLAGDDFGTAYCVSAGQPRYYLLLTEVHRLLASLFTIIPI